MIRQVLFCAVFIYQSEPHSPLQYLYTLVTSTKLRKSSAILHQSHWIDWTFRSSIGSISKKVLPQHHHSKFAGALLDTKTLEQ